MTKRDLNNLSDTELLTRLLRLEEHVLDGRTPDDLTVEEFAAVAEMPTNDTVSNAAPVQSVFGETGDVPDSAAPVTSVDGDTGDVVLPTEIYRQDTQPTNTSDGVLWIDTSKDDRPTKTYSQAVGGWVSVGISDYTQLENTPSKTLSDPSFDSDTVGDTVRGITEVFREDFNFSATFLDYDTGSVELLSGKGFPGPNSAGNYVVDSYNITVGWAFSTGQYAQDVDLSITVTNNDLSRIGLTASNIDFTLTANNGTYNNSDSAVVSSNIDPAVLSDIIDSNESVVVDWTVYADQGMASDIDLNIYLDIEANVIAQWPHSHSLEVLP